jgi:hypothetical protein
MYNINEVSFPARLFQICVSLYTSFAFHLEFPKHKMAILSFIILLQIFSAVAMARVALLNTDINIPKYIHPSLQSSSSISNPSSSVQHSLTVLASQSQNLQCAVLTLTA